MSGELSEELTVATRLAREAGATIMRVYATDFSVAYKGKGDPVTQADQLANDLIVKGLQKAFPTDLIVAEESPPPSESLTASRVWYVDPLDGTKEFIAKNGEFSVMIGLAVGGQAYLGVVYRPDGDVLYTGVVGQGAWVEVNGIRKALMVDSTRESSSMTLAVSRSHRNPLIEKICEAVGVSQEIPSGSVGLKIGLIAEGKADLYLEPGPYTSVRTIHQRVRSTVGVRAHPIKKYSRSGRYQWPMPCTGDRSARPSHRPTSTPLTTAARSGVQGFSFWKDQSRPPSF